MRTKTQEMIDFIVDNGLHLLAITDTWLNPGERDGIITSEITLSGYKIQHVPRGKGKWGGMAIILKSTFSTKQEKVTKYTSFEIIDPSVLY